MRAWLVGMILGAYRGTIIFQLLTVGLIMPPPTWLALNFRMPYECLGCIDTPARLPRGDRQVDTVCKCGRNAPMSLLHVAQACGLRRKLHDNVVLFVGKHEEAESCWCHYGAAFWNWVRSTKAWHHDLHREGVDFPGHACASWFCCLQSGYLQQKKIRKYNQLYFLDAVRECYGCNVPVICMSSSFRMLKIKSSYYGSDQ